MISGITTKCWILALFVRDDGQRLLLGDGMYEFQQKQQHFKANTIVNDAVDVQGNDGTLLAGQVRRATTQSFDGYIGDATSTPQEIEQYRRNFFAFFLKNHFYEVIYIFQDGTAIKRQKGFLIDAPEVKELFQISPAYHVALNFEDVNYYEYNENAEGQEIYGESADIPLVSAGSGGQVWDEYGIVWEYSSKNLYKPIIYGESYGIDATLNASSGYIELSGTGTQTWSNPIEWTKNVNLPAGTYTFSISNALPVTVNLRTTIGGSGVDRTISAGDTSVTFTTSDVSTQIRIWFSDTNGANVDGVKFRTQLESGASATSWENPYLGQKWEAGGGGGIVTIDVDSIDIVYPVITIKGPANSPTIEDITTNTRLSFDGNVAASQTLIIDTRSQTAKLNGTSVISSISGGWLMLAPGINQLSYLATNDTAPDATIEWSEVVG